MSETSQLSESYLEVYNKAVSRLISLCEDNKWIRLALYGAGRHSKRVIESLRDAAPHVKVLCLLDDNAPTSQVVGIPTIRPTELPSFNVQVLVISSDVWESALYRKACGFHMDIPVLRMYAYDDWPSATPAINTLLEEISALPADMHQAGVMMTPVLHAMVKHTRDMTLNCTAETGSGKTTLLLSHLSRKHIVFSIDEGNQSISAVKHSPLFNKANVNWIEGPTQLTMPHYTFEEPLDFALIDGPHGYPFPDIEYFYFYPQLRPNSLLVLDDIHIPNITNIYNFLKEEEMFTLIDVVECTAFFRRTRSVTFPTTFDGWWWQGYNRKHFPLDKHTYLRDTLTSNAQAEMNAFSKKPGPVLHKRND